MIKIKENNLLKISLMLLLIIFNVLIYVLIKNSYISVLMVSISLIILLCLNFIELYDLIIIFSPIMFYIKIPFLINISLSDIIVPLAFFKYCLSYRKDNVKNMKIIITYGLVLIGAMLLSLLNLMDLVNFDILSAIISIFKIVICLLYSIITYKYIEKNKKDRFLKMWFCIGMVFFGTLIIGVIAYSRGVDLGLSYEMRGTGTFKDPNLASAYIFIALSFMSAYCIEKRKKKVFLILTCILAMICIFLTASKGAVISFICSFIIVLFILFMNCQLKKIFKIIVSLLCICAGLFFVYNNSLQVKNIIKPHYERYNSFFKESKRDNTLKEREKLWEIAFDLGKTHPVIGVGVDQFMSASLQYENYKVNNIEHNSYLCFWAETGIIGLIAFIWIYIFLFIRIVKLCSKNKTGYIYLFSLCACMISMFSINLQNFRVLWIFIAYLLYEQSIKKEKAED